MVESVKEKFEFVKKFSYRDYQGLKTSRFPRIFSLATFEMTNTWRKSTIGKVLLGLTLFLNVFVAIVAVPILSAQSVEDKSAFVRQTIFKYASGYLAVTDTIILPLENIIIPISFSIGILIIGLLGIAGSGFFADDKQGKVIELYLSRMKREDYAVGKVLGMFMYCNIFITLPMLIVSIWIVQGLGQNQLDYFFIYLSLIISGAIISSFFTIFTLVLSSLVEKRAYASLSFFIGYFLVDALAASFIMSDPTNEFYLLLVPTYVISLLIYIIGGNFDLSIDESSFAHAGSNTTVPLFLNNGTGLEWFHVLTVVFLVLLVGLLFLLFKIHRMTTNEL